MMVEAETSSHVLQSCIMLLLKVHTDG